jgi:hypothetical protein
MISVSILSLLSRITLRRMVKLNVTIGSLKKLFGLVGPDMDDWDRFIPHLEFSLNNSVVSATGCTPFSLNRLTPPLSPSSLAFGVHKQQRGQPPAIEHRLRFFLAKQALAEAKQRMHQQMNQKALYPTFCTGDRVLLSMNKVALHHPSFRKKFTPRWIGPCTILEIVGRSAARLALPAALRECRMHDVFHDFSVLKTHHAPTHPPESGDLLFKPVAP